MKHLILASSSPRRKELLAQMQIPFSVQVSDVDEQMDETLSPEELVVRLASEKAKAVQLLNQEEDVLILGADTIVVFEQTVLGKPNGQEEAFATLKRLNGHTHSVYTGVAIADGPEVHTFYEETKVTFWELEDDELRAYVNSGEPLDKAGSYGIQGIGAFLVKEIQGDYYAVVGLPISRTVRTLKSLGYTWQPTV